MNASTLRRTGLAAAALTLMLGTTACGGDDNNAGSGDDTTSESPADSDMTEESPSDDMSETDAAMDPAAQTFGEACSAVPADGPGSFGGMVQDPVATAAGNNPLLGTLVTAVGAVDGLGDTLNSAPELTVFAPTDDAFAKIPEAELDAVLKDQEQLSTILSHHVVEGRLGPDEVVGEHTTLNGDTVTVEGDTDQMTIGDATVLCGNVPTANATVYVIDTVLMPS